MKAQLITTHRGGSHSVKNIELPDNYDGDPYGDTVPFAVGSNQWIRTDPDLFEEETDDENYLQP